MKTNQPQNSDNNDAIKKYEKAYLKFPDPLCTKSKEVLKMLAEGQSSDNILNVNSSIDDIDVITAAKDALIQEERVDRLLKAVIRKHAQSDDVKIIPVSENSGAPWSNDEDTELQAMKLEGKTSVEMARHFKRSRSAIDFRLLQLERDGLLEIVATYLYD